MFKNIVAFVCAIFMMGQAFAMNEERILAESTKQGNWEQFLQNLSQVKLGEVTGYDSETNTIYTAAVLVWVCQNQAPAWQAACSNKPERFAALKARNGWGDTITSSQLQAQGQGDGIYFPFATSTATPVAKAEASVVTTPAPVAPATPPVSNVDQEQIAQWAKFAQGNDERIRAQAERLAVINGQLAEKSAVIARLERELQEAKEAGTSATATTLAALEAAKVDLAQFEQAMSEAVKSAVALAVKPVVQDVASLKDDVKGVKDSLIFKYGNLIYLGVVSALLLSGIGIAMGVTNGRKAKRALIAANEAKTGVHEVSEAITGLANEVATVDERLSAVAEQAGLKVVKVEFDRATLLSDLNTIAVGGTANVKPTVFLADGNTITYEVVYRKVQDKYVTTEDVEKQTEVLNITLVPKRLTGAAFAGRLKKVIESSHLKVA